MEQRKAITAANVEFDVPVELHASRWTLAEKVVKVLQQGRSHRGSPCFCPEEKECAGFEVSQYALSWAEPNKHARLILT